VPAKYLKKSFLILRAGAKGTVVMLVLTVAASASFVVGCVFGFDTIKTRRIRIVVTHFTAKLVCMVIGLKSTVEDFTKANRQKTNGTLWVSNHLSYLDAVALASLRPIVFTSSQEIKATLGLGSIAAAAGTYFVERRGREKKEQEVSDLAKLLGEGFDVLVFPEATSSNGEMVLPFKKTFFHTAVVAGAKVLPICLNYQTLGGKPFNKTNRDLVCWYADMTFLKHFWQLLQLSRIELKITFMDPLKSMATIQLGNEQEHTFKELSRLAWQNISQVFVPCQ